MSWRYPQNHEEPGTLSRLDEESVSDEGVFAEPYLDSAAAEIGTHDDTISHPSRALSAGPLMN